MNISNIPPFRFLTAMIVLLAHLPMAPASPGSGNDFTPIAYNDSSLVVDLGVGLWAWPFPVHHNDDGLVDLMVVCTDKPYSGTYVFHNSGQVNPTTGLPIFQPAIRIGAAASNPQVSYVDGDPVAMSLNRVYPEFLRTGFSEPMELPVSKTVHVLEKKSPVVRIRGNQWRYVDYDGDRDNDLVVGIGYWGDYGWDNAFNASGEWTNGPLRGYVYLLRNDGSAENPQYAKPVKIEAGGAPIDVFGSPVPNFADFDGDGDLDLLCAEFIDGFTYFENIGTPTRPEYAAGRILTALGNPLETDLCMIIPVAHDFDGDGDPDLVVGEEDGRVAYLEHTGAVIDGIPQFKQPRFFSQFAGDVKFGALSAPASIDWDGDGLDDIIAGNTAGYIGFIRNLGGFPARWAKPVYLTAGGRTIRIVAGENGSIQGPAEEKWGYSNVSVGDWDGDGLPDILELGIWGRVTLYRNVGSRTEPRLAQGEPLQVDWQGGPPKPEWNWWNPEGNELVTQWRCTPLMIDWDTNGLMDLVTLDTEGYLVLFHRRRSSSGNLELSPPQRVFYGKGVSTFNSAGLPADPGIEMDGPLRMNSGTAGKSGRRTFCFIDWDGDGIRDMITNSQPNAAFFRGLGKNSEGNWVFQFEGPMGERKLAGHSTAPTIVDWNKDQIPDLLLGAEDGYFYYLENPRSQH